MIVYIAGPYRAATPHQIVKNIRAAEKVAIKYWQRGHAVICPHKNSGLLDGTCPDEYFLAGDIEILKRCDAIVMLPGWEKSSGARHELEIAELERLEIIYE